MKQGWRHSWLAWASKSTFPGPGVHDFSAMAGVLGRCWKDLLQPADYLGLGCVSLLPEKIHDIDTGQNHDRMLVVTNLFVSLLGDMGGGDENELPMAAPGDEPANLLDADATSSRGKSLASKVKVTHTGSDGSQRRCCRTVNHQEVRPPQPDQAGQGLTATRKGPDGAHAG